MKKLFLTLLTIAIAGTINTYVLDPADGYSPTPYQLSEMDENPLDSAMKYINGMPISDACKAGIILLNVRKGEDNCPHATDKRACSRAWKELVRLRDKTLDQRLMHHLNFNSAQKDRRKIQGTYDQRLEFLWRNELPIPYVETIALEKGKEEYSIVPPDGWETTMRMISPPGSNQTSFEEILVAPNGKEARIMWVDGNPEARVILRTEEWRDANGKNVGTDWFFW